jgi:bla regulator protein blaR1
MTGHLAFIARGIGTGVANHLWQSSVFAGAAWLIALLLRRNRAHLRYGLWLAASVKFLIPFALLIDLGGFLPKPQHAAISLHPTLSSAVGVVSQPFSDLQIAQTINVQTLSEQIVALLPNTLAGVWLFGVLTVLLVWHVRWRRIYKSLKCAVPMKNGREVEILRRLETLAQSRGRVPVLRSRDVMEPGIFGMFRPVMLWPEQLTEQLESEHVEAIMAHELMHVRRHDNLTATIHMVVEAVFWFHPMVWWIESRLLEERERACDEAVLQLECRPEVYAESLLKACRFCAESPLKCVSGITSADLTKRIVRIMTEHVVQKLDFSRKLLLGVAGFASLAIPVAFGFVHISKLQTEDTAATMKVNSPRTFGLASITNSDAGAQAEDKAHHVPSFDVASIKPGRPGEDHVTMFYTQDGFTATDVPLEVLIREAYGVEGSRVVGAPSWTSSKNFDIEAKVDMSVVDELKELSLDERRIMLQPLLADRFRLKVHWETKELPVYALVIGKNGPKFHEAKPGDTYPKGIIGPNGPTGAGALWVQGDQLTGQGTTLQGLVDILSRQVGTDVLDETGLTGKYDFTMQLPRVEGSVTTLMPPTGDQRAPDDAPPPESSGPSIFTAVQEQLGLKLESTKGQRKCLVIDHVEQPSEN